MATDQQIDIGKMPLEQLSMLKNNFEKEIEHLSRLLNSLRHGSSRFKSSVNAVASLQQLKDGAEIMVPLASSLYAPGTLKANSNAIIDIGTGYFVEKKMDDALESLQAKYTAIDTSVQEASIQLQRKQESLGTINELMQMRMRQYDQQKAASDRTVAS